jgi:hypothetical protein
MSGDLVGAAGSASPVYSYGWIDDGNEVRLANSGEPVGIGSSLPAFALEIGNLTKALNVSGFLYANSTNIGIGTSNPTQALAVNGSASINGELIVANRSYGEFYLVNPYNFATNANWFDLPMNGSNDISYNIIHSNVTTPAIMTFNVSGTYQFGYYVTQAWDTGHHINLRLYKNNNTEVIGSYVQSGMSGTNVNTNVYGNAITKLNAGDNITLQGWVDIQATNEINYYSGANQPAPTTPVYAEVIVTKIGP